MKNLNLMRGMLGATLVAFVLFFSGCNKCKDVTCLNGGSCDEETGECVCATGYSGADCGVAANAKFVGTWMRDENCTQSGANNGLSTAISAVQGNPLGIKITGIRAFSNYELSAVIGEDGRTFSIAKQKIGFNDYFRSNSGEISSDGSTINFEYDYWFIDSVNVLESCTVVLNK